MQEPVQEYLMQQITKLQRLLQHSQIFYESSAIIQISQKCYEIIICIWKAQFLLQIIISLLMMKFKGEGTVESCIIDGLRNTSLQQSVLYLNSCSQINEPQVFKIEDITFAELLMDIDRAVTSEIAAEVKQLLIRDFQLQKISDGIEPANFKISVTNRFFQQFYLHRLTMFIHDYLKENGRQVKKNNESQSTQTKKTKHFYELEQMKEFPEEQQKQAENIEQVPQEPSSSYSQFKQSLKHQQPQQIKPVFHGPIHQANYGAQSLPKFISQSGSSNNYWHFSKWMIALDLTQHFTTEIQEVKQILIKQIRQERYLFNAYQQFANKYIQFDLIRSGRYEQYQEDKCARFKQQLKFYEEQYLNEDYTKIHFVPGYPSFLLSEWTNIYQKTKEIVEKTRINPDKLRQAFIKRLEKIILYYIPGVTMRQKVSAFGECHYDYIFICLNQFPHDMNAEEFRRCFLKPFLMKVIFHQMAHSLLKDLQLFKPEQVPLDESNYSLRLKRKTIGSSILTLMNKMREKILNVFRQQEMESRSADNYQKIRKDMLSRIQLAYNLIKQGKDLIEKLKQNHKQLIELKGMLTLLIHLVKISKLLRSVDWEKFLKHGQYSIIFSDQEQQEPEDSPSIFLSESIPIQIRLLFALFLAQEQLNIIKIPINQKYKKLKSAIIQNKIRIDITMVFFKEISNPIKPILDNFEQIDCLIKLFIIERYPIVALNQRITKLAQSFSNLNTNQWQNTLSYSLKQQSQRKNQVNFNLKPFWFKQVPKGLFELEEKYEHMMKFLKDSQIYLISCQIPDFYNISPDEDSGHYLERALLPTFVQQWKIYQKDYELLKDLTYFNSIKIGQLDSRAKQQEFISITATNQKKIANELSISMKRSHRCRHYFPQKWTDIKQKSRIISNQSNKVIMEPENRRQLRQQGRLKRKEIQDFAKNQAQQ